MDLEWVMVERAPYARIVRALDTVTYARRLKALGGPAWHVYRDLLRCERFVPERNRAHLKGR